MTALAAQYPRYGYRRIAIFLEREGIAMSFGRCHRLWRQAQLQVPRKRPRKRITTGRPRPNAPTGANQMWSYDRPPQHPKHVRILHHKTGQILLQPLEAEGRKLYPELEAYLAELPHLGVPIVVTTGSRGAWRPYAMVYAQAKVREAREQAQLGSHVTLDACRHGGMTELGDAELAEQGVMALSGHKTPQAARLYVKRTDRQQTAAATKRPEWAEANEEHTRVDLEQPLESRLGSIGRKKPL